MPIYKVTIKHIEEHEANVCAESKEEAEAMAYKMATGKHATVSDYYYYDCEIDELDTTQNNVALARVESTETGDSITPPPATVAGREGTGLT